MMHDAWLIWNDMQTQDWAEISFSTKRSISLQQEAMIGMNEKKLMEMKIIS